MPSRLCQSVSFDANTYLAVRGLADRRGTTFSKVIRQMVAHYMREGETMDDETEDLKRKVADLTARNEDLEQQLAEAKMANSRIHRVARDSLPSEEGEDPVETDSALEHLRSLDESLLGNRQTQSFIAVVRAMMKNESIWRRLEDVTRHYATMRYPEPTMRFMSTDERTPLDPIYRRLVAEGASMQEATKALHAWVVRIGEKHHAEAVA